MFEYELHRIRSAELRRQAADARLAREAVRSRRAARREAGAAGAAGHTTATADALAVPEAHTDRRDRRRLPRAA
ncbi:hypothetical protein ABT215_43930 [Streptomyces sp900105755]|uniref:hypothetical protein n=1 Tax=unclassified Streptomyces TaxID=2593676 RepID=UPI0008997EF0|nr:hypothetical protein [Streptomyces sp. Ag109_O5-10]SEE52483.1 hypothetical protein SAMN05216533_2594 [Streptomyces sp. Ag109_O5-10]